MNQKLKGKWAFITGSSRGIGQQIAIALANCSCNVVVHGRTLKNTEETVERLKPFDVKVETVAGELSNLQEVRRICNSVYEKVGSIDILYNNAAIQNKIQKVWDIPIEEWKRVFEVNFFAVVEICSFFIPKMIEKGFGRVINLTSGIKDQPDLSPYSVTKAAIDKYTRDIAAELKGTNVLVSTLDPGWLKTDMGSQRAPNEVETVIPGAIVPALLEDFGPNGEFYSAQNYKYLSL